MSRPLTVVLTRPRPQADDWLKRLAALGADAVSLPLIEIVAGAPQAAAEAWHLLPGAALVMFVSPNAVAHFFKGQTGQTGEWPADTLAACVGPGSARALRDAGVPAHLIVQPPADAESLDSEHLWPLLATHDWQGRLVLIVRGDGGRDWLAERLREQGARTRDFSVYQRRCPVLDAAEQALLADIVAAAGARFVWLFSSSEAIGHLASLLDADWSGQCAIATHARIAERARQLGFGNVVLARPDATAVAAAAAEMQGGDLQSFAL
jgi:uroporphyrinogen-III synthase